MCLIILRLIFFQAEDGIRDIGVTGVQTCALPISMLPRICSAERVYEPGSSGMNINVLQAASGVGIDWSQARLPAGRSTLARSEERRVGKECRSRWSPHH